MNQNRSAAGCRRSAIVERIRLREEWSALKGYDAKTVPCKVLTNKLQNNMNSNKKVNPSTMHSNRALRPINKMHNVHDCDSASNEVLQGIVALVDVGTESRAFPLRSVLKALGATVVSSWSPLVTHVLWSQGGSRETRAQARALGNSLVSPLWVESCAAAGRRLPEHTFPAPTRHSDLPSPRTLRQLLKKADMENIPINNLQTNSSEKVKEMRLRLSSDTSVDKSTDKSRDESKDKSDKREVQSYVNTAPRRAKPLSSPINPLENKKSRRKLFIQKEVASDDASEDSLDTEIDTVPKKIIKKRTKLMQLYKQDLVRTERIARKMLTQFAKTNQKTCNKPTNEFRIVLTGMSREERRSVAEAVKSLGGKLQNKVNRKTTHVLLGSCGINATQNRTRAGEDQILNISGITRHSSEENLTGTQTVVPRKPRTLNALEGAARGCRVLSGKWALDSLHERKWMHHVGYEIHHLKKMSQKARIERAALGFQSSEYAYEVFHNMRVLLKENAEHKDLVKRLLRLCGANVIDEQDGDQRDDLTTQNESRDQNDGNFTDNFDIIIGVNVDEISSTWVFDSVATGRLRTKKKYINVN